MILELLDSPFKIFLLTILLGYLMGSLSFARIITFIFTKSNQIDPLQQVVPGSDEIFESNTISATTVSQNLGKRYGCITSILDMLKVALPALMMKYLFPELPYYLVTAAFGILGHNYPLYHGFKGGRGESPMIGAMVVINWFGIFITNACAMILGYLTGSVLVSRYGWYILMIGWYWIYFKSIYYVGFMILANFLFWFSMSKDLATYAKLKQDKGTAIKQEDVSDFLMMGRGYGRFLDLYGVPSLLRKRS